MDSEAGSVPTAKPSTTTATTNSNLQCSILPPPMPPPLSAEQIDQDNAETSNPNAPSSTNTSSSTNDDASRKETTVPTACLACRSKHLKCDGSNPCSRCIVSGFECIYVASRRGYRGPRRTATANPNKRRAASPITSSAVSEYPAIATSESNPSPTVAPSFASPSVTNTSSPTSQRHDGSPHASDTQVQNTMARIPAPDLSRPSTSTNMLRPLTLPEKCVDAFYHNFFASHPFVLPKPHLLAAPKEPSIEMLLAAIRWVGSLFVPEADSIRESLFENAYQLIYAPLTTSDGYLVQAMVLLVVALDGSCQQEKARQILMDVEAIALQIGLNTKPFAILHGRGLPILEESWRRTWWDLFVVDGMVAGVHRVTNFLLFDVPTDVPLPCEEHQYLSGNIPPPNSLEDLEHREFSGDTRDYSSFSYRILSGRILGRMMRTPPFFGPEDENVARIEALLTNWRLHLPQSKRDALQQDGQLDEMMFQAQMMNNATSIMLHQPFSQLDSAPAQKINSCAPYQLIQGGDNMYNTHTKHTIMAAAEISKLITHRVPLLSHTHFFTCVVTLSSIVHLSRWALFWVAHDEFDLRQQIRLNVGALNHLSSVWSAASNACGQVRTVAQDIYRVKKQQQNNSQYWLGFSQDAMISSIAVDESIIGDIENLNNQQ